MLVFTVIALVSILREAHPGPTELGSAHKSCVIHNTELAARINESTVEQDPLPFGETI